MVVESVSSMIPTIDVLGPSAKSDGFDSVNIENEKLGEMNNIVYVFDIDGTLADCSHRLQLIDKRLHPRAKDRDYNRFFDEMDDCLLYTSPSPRD